VKEEPLRVLVLGAHPDDCDFSAGGTALRFTQLGHKVCFVSLTNGDAGHHLIGGLELARRRYAETQASARIAGLEYLVLDNHDGELLPTLENRRQVITLIREYQADLVLAHRADEYHPDHRAVGILVQDASYLVGVPNIVPLVPHLQRLPVICHFAGHRAPVLPSEKLVVVDISTVMERKWDMLHCHTSQVYEWMPYNQDRSAEVPATEAARRAWLPVFLGRLNASAAYGAELDNTIKYAESFEVCPYGAQLTAERRARLWPF
jgi:LmbE family N-acetylglucosaminyl deacetylase